MASIINNLAYSPSIEELIITAITIDTRPNSKLADALAKFFTLTVSLKKVSVL